MVTPILLAIGAIAGSICGMIGAIVHKMRQGLASAHASCRARPPTLTSTPVPRGGPRSA